MTRATKETSRVRPTYVTFAQQFKPEFWPGWDADLIRSKDVRTIGEEVVRRYEAAGGQAEGVWLIKHDKDLAVDGRPVVDGMHAIIQQSKGRNTKGKLYASEIDQAIGFTKSVVRAPARGGRLENAQAYLIHAKNPEKHQYSPSEVVTLRGEDYLDIERKFRSKWARGALVKSADPTSSTEWKKLGDALVEKILAHEVTYEEALLNPDYQAIYARNKSLIDGAFDIAARAQMAREAQRLEAGDFRKTIVWINGASQTGKTYLLKQTVAFLQEQTGWRVYDSAAKNSADKYRGEEIFVLNEPGNRAFEWADLLTLLGPREAGPLSARYSNKDKVAPRVIIVAVSADIVDYAFFTPGKRSTGDSLDQLLFRLSLYIRSHKDDPLDQSEAPRYSVGRVTAGEPYDRTIIIPGANDRFNCERLELHAYCNEIVIDADAETARAVIIDEVAQRSPGVIDAESIEPLHIAPPKTTAQPFIKGTDLAIFNARNAPPEQLEKSKDDSPFDVFKQPGISFGDTETQHRK